MEASALLRLASDRVSKTHLTACLQSDPFENNVKDGRGSFVVVYESAFKDNVPTERYVQNRSKQAVCYNRGRNKYYTSIALQSVKVARYSRHLMDSSRRLRKQLRQDCQMFANYASEILNGSVINSMHDSNYRHRSRQK